VQFEFVILDWAACADSLTTHQDWLAWASRAPVRPAQQVSQIPAVSEMPAMMRRRIDRLGRLACQVAYWCQPDAASSPLVFASRYGDAQRSLTLLGDLVTRQPLSPTGFALSVHNAISALFSIARGDVNHAVVVTAGRATAQAALVEASALLADGAPEVLVVFYEAPLPDAYAHFQDESACEYAWAMRLASARRAGEGVLVRASIDVDTHAGAQEILTLPAGLLAFHELIVQWMASSPERCHA
jgi:hypothetical protein